MTAASTLAGDSLGAPVWLLTRPTMDAAPTAPPTMIVARMVASPVKMMVPSVLAAEC